MKPIFGRELLIWKPYLIWFDVILSVLVILLLGVLHVDIVVISVSVLIIPYLLLTKRSKSLHYLLIAFIVSLIWMIIAKNEYKYNFDLLSIAGISLFPLLAWTLGLFMLYVLYSRFLVLLTNPTFFKKLLLFVGIYWPLLLLAESTGYHAFNIRNEAAAMYPGFSFCDCMHAPAWMQVAYFSLGIIFFLACYNLVDDQVRTI